MSRLGHFVMSILAALCAIACAFMAEIVAALIIDGSVSGWWWLAVVALGFLSIGNGYIAMDLAHDALRSEPVDALHDAAEADLRRVRNELRDRLDRCTDHDHGLALGWLVDNHPDLVNEALDETGAPS